MKYILLLSAALIFSACSHGHKHEGHDHGSAHKHSDGSDCGCDKGEAKHDHSATPATAAAAPAGEWKVTGLTEEEFKAMYLKNSAALGKTCSAAAAEYCGKTTKDLQITEADAKCLVEENQRSTRQVLSKLDKTPCSKLLKKLVALKKK